MLKLKQLKKEDIGASNTSLQGVLQAVPLQYVRREVLTRYFEQTNS